MINSFFMLPLKSSHFQPPSLPFIAASFPVNSFFPTISSIIPDLCLSCSLTSCGSSAHLPLHLLLPPFSQILQSIWLLAPFAWFPIYSSCTFFPHCTFSIIVTPTVFHPFTRLHFPPFVCSWRCHLFITRSLAHYFFSACFHEFLRLIWSVPALPFVSLPHHNPL